MNPGDDGHVFDLIIIGGGPAGTSAAIYASRGKLDVIVIDKDLGRGAMGGEHLVANFPGFPKPIKAEDLLKRMRKQAENLGAQFVQDKVIYTDFRKEEKLVASPGKKYRARSIVIATGSMGREPSLPGEAMFQGRGVAYCAICDGAYFEGKTVAVTGQVDRVIEELDLISKYATKIHFISPTGKIKDEENKRLSSFEKVAPMEGYRVKEIVGSMKMEAVLLQGPDGDKRLETDGIFVYLQGNRPVIDYLVDGMEKGENGCIKTDDKMATTVPGVFAVGDLTCRKVRQISIAVGEGCKAALAVESFLRGKEGAHSQWGT
jgi:thioredoxin reductase (NADPH)